VPNETALAAVESSNMPSSKKSFFRRILDSGVSVHREDAMGVMRQSARALKSVPTAISEVAEGGLTSVALAAVDVYQKDGGLDYKGKYPIDAGLATVGIVGSVLAAGHAGAAVARNVGRSAWDVFAFRKAHTYFSEKKLAHDGAGPQGTVIPGPAANSPASGAAGTAGGGSGSPSAGFGFGGEGGANESLARAARDL
jgi:hypothetical protein